MEKEAVTAQGEAQEALRLQKAKNNLVWLGTFSIIMMFAAFTSAYLVSAADNYWVIFDLPSSFNISTILVLLGSVTMLIAVKAGRKSNRKMLSLMLGVTLLLGAGFTYFQTQGWSQLLEKGHGVTGKITWAQGEYGADYTIVKDGETLVLEYGEFFLPSDRARSRPLNAKLNTLGNTASSYMYIMTGVHVLHLVVGLLIILMLLLRSISGRYDNGNWFVIKRGAVYWHFLAGLWVYLFLFLQYIH
jgi:cytochrome c oxidase subunit 3